MINKIDCYLLTCDNCQEHFEDSYSGFSIFTTAETAIEKAQNGDWHIEDDKHYCPKCFTINDDDSLIINKERVTI